MSNFEKKEQNLNQLIDKLNSISLSYSQPKYEIEKIKSEKKNINSVREAANGRVREVSCARAHRRRAAALSRRRGGLVGGAAVGSPELN